MYRTYNPLARPAFRLGLGRLGEAPVTAAGPAPSTGAPYYEEDHQYVLNITLTANLNVVSLLNIDGDADFLWIAKAGSSTGIYRLQFTLPNSRRMSNAQINNANYIGTAQWPVPLERPYLCPAGSTIAVNITDTSAAGNTVQLVFIGINRYRTTQG